MSVSIIIPTRNQDRILDRAITSIADSAASAIDGLEVIIISNQSDEIDSQHYLAGLPSLVKSLGIDRLRVIDFDHAFNFSAMNNAAVELSRGDVLCFLNNDVEIITSDWLDQLVTEVSHAQTGCAGALLYYPNDTVQHAGVIVGMDTIAAHPYVGMPRAEVPTHPYFQARRVCTAVTGACLAIQRSLFERVGGFDTALAVAFNDIDLCLKTSQAGYPSVWVPSVELYHHESLSRGKGIKTAEAKKRHRDEIRFMQSKWGPQVLDDPYWRASHRADEVANDQHVQLVKRRWRSPRSVYYQHKDLINNG